MQGLIEHSAPNQKFYYSIDLNFFIAFEHVAWVDKVIGELKAQVV